MLETLVQLFDAVSRIYNSVIFETLWLLFKVSDIERQPLQPEDLTSNSFHVSAQKIL